MTSILHITTRDEWAAAERNGEYRAPSLETEGFIHCSTLRQTVDTANAFFRGRNDLVLLLIDASAARAEVRYEPAAEGGRASAGLFPHLYGPLNLDAVRKVIAFPSNAEGQFELPSGLGDGDGS